MKYRRWMNGEDYLIYEGCWPLATISLVGAMIAAAVVWVLLKVI